MTPGVVPWMSVIVAKLIRLIYGVFCYRERVYKKGFLGKRKPPENVKTSAGYRRRAAIWFNVITMLSGLHWVNSRSLLGLQWGFTGSLSGLNRGSVGSLLGLNRVGTGYRRLGTGYREWTFLLLLRAVYNPLWIMARVPLSPGALRGTGRRGRPGSQRVIISAAIGRR